MFYHFLKFHQRAPFEHTVGLPWCSGSLCGLLPNYYSSLFAIVRFQDSNYLFQNSFLVFFSNLKRRRSVSEKDEKRKTRQDRRKKTKYERANLLVSPHVSPGETTLKNKSPFSS